MGPILFGAACASICMIDSGLSWPTAHADGMIRRAALLHVQHSVQAVLTVAVNPEVKGCHIPA